MFAPVRARASWLANNTSSLGRVLLLHSGERLRHACIGTHFHAALPLPGRRCAEISTAVYRKHSQLGFEKDEGASVGQYQRQSVHPFMDKAWHHLLVGSAVTGWLVVLVLACSSLSAFRSCVYSWVSSRSCPLSVVRGGSIVRMGLRMHACHGPWSIVSVTEPLTGAAARHSL